MTSEDINDIINAICPNDEDYEKPCISPKYLRQELEQLALDQKQWNEEPTTKNDLGVDLISRADAIRVASGYCHPSNVAKELAKLPSVTPQEPRWIPVSEGLPETDNKNSINNYNVLLWVKDKNDPKDEPQIYLGKLRKVNGDDGSHNFWGIKTEPCDWTIWGWSYFHEPEVIAWMPLPKPYEPQESEG